MSRLIKKDIGKNSTVLLLLGSKDINCELFTKIGEPFFMAVQFNG